MRRTLSCRGIVLSIALGCGSATAQDPAAPQPTADGAAVESGVALRNITRMGEPWLRLNTAGHTGTVEALAFAPDSRRLFSAGLDKVVQVWDLAALPDGQLRNLRRDFLRERTIRWQVARGPRGAIFALATSPADGLLAIAGYGAMGSTGEILLVNPFAGTLVQVLEGHRQTVCALGFTTEGTALVSVDVRGETRVWRRPDWKSTVIYRDDVTTYGRDRAARIANLPHIRPTVAVGSTKFVVPVLVGADTAELEWRLQEIELANPRNARTLPTPHRGLVTALSSNPDGSRLVSADLAGNIYVFDLSRGGAAKRLSAGGVGRSLALTPDGATLVVGTTIDSKSQRSRLQVWDLAAQRVTVTRDLVDHVHACAISPDGKRMAYVGGPLNEVYVEQIASPQQQVTALRGWQRKIFKVAFSRHSPPYRVAFGTSFRDGGFNDYGDLAESFDPGTGQLVQGLPIDASQWSTAQAAPATWQVRLADNGYRLELTEGNVSRGAIQLDRQWQGQARAYCWITDPEGKPRAIAVGTDTQNGVYVYGPSDGGPCPLWRQFRGHQDHVTSLAVSADRRYLVSGSVDGTLQFWSLDEYQQGSSTRGRWGAVFAVRDDRLVVEQMLDAGPLYRRGIRGGDVINRIGWIADKDEARDATAPAEILARLGDLAADTQVFFEYTRAARQPKSFQLVSAWQPVATLFASGEREWAFWTPEGYYSASANGHALFGWQINHGLHRLPEFFRADQFRKTLERPAVMRQLLEAGTLDGAFRQVRVEPATETDQALVEQIAAAPRVEIISPRSGDVITERSTKVRARVRVPSDGHIVQTRVFANGVGAPRGTVVGQHQDDTGQFREVNYEWDLPLPRGSRQMIQVFVGTTAKTTAFERVVVERSAPAPPPASEQPRLYLLAVGVSRYSDPDIESLDFALSDAKAVLRALEKDAGGLYEVKAPVLLADEQVTRAGWTETFSSFVETLRHEAQPDDLLVIFFAGHGQVDERSQTYQFLCHDARIGSLGDGSATISWNDFEMLADIPCRKLALLDTCHSGAIQGARPDQTLAIREFQENVIFTVAAAAGNEGSLEAKEWGHGAFTKSLLDAVGGGADTTSDGVITLDELVGFVGRAVPELTAAKGYQQHPVAAPEELLQLVVLPVSQVRNPAGRALNPSRPPTN